MIPHYTNIDGLCDRMASFAFGMMRNPHTIAPSVLEVRKATVAELADCIIWTRERDV